jgi:hypothetical protein
VVERRRFERHGLAGKVVVERATPNGGAASMAVHLKEMSVGGFSGTYFGSVAPAAGDLLSWRHEDGGATPVRLVWSRKSLECIHHLGFQLVESATIAS